MKTRGSGEEKREAGRGFPLRAKGGSMLDDEEDERDEEEEEEEEEEVE